MSKHPVDGWLYPKVERLEIFDCGAKIGAMVIMEDGSVRAMRWNVPDIIEKADINIESRVRF